MAEEIKKTAAARTPKTTATTAEKTAETAKTYSQEEVDAKISAAVEAAVAKALQQVKADSSNNNNSQQTTVIQVKNDEMITVLYMGAVAEGSSIPLGKLGRLNGAGVPLDISKKEFFQALDIRMRKMLADRRLIIVDGLTDEERQRYGVAYKEGELLSQDMYYKLLDYTPDELKVIYPALCESHKRAVAKLFLTAYENGDNKVSIEKVKVINDLSKALDADGLLTPVLEAMGKKLAK